MVQTFYSVLKLFTGFATAAFIAWKLIVSRAMLKAAMAAIPKTHQLIATLYGKSCNHLLIANHATGKAISAAINTGFKKFSESIVVIFITLAPRIFLIPISLFLCSALKAANPKR